MKALRALHENVLTGPIAASGNVSALILVSRSLRETQTAKLVRGVMNMGRVDTLEDIKRCFSGNAKILLLALSSSNGFHYIRRRKFSKSFTSLEANTPAYMLMKLFGPQPEIC